MTIEDEGEYSCEWSNINEVQFAKGKLKLFDSNIIYNEIKSITVDFDCDIEAGESSYIGVYGIKGFEGDNNPLRGYITILSYYIIEKEENWKIPEKYFMGTIIVDGSEYDVYKRESHVSSIAGTWIYYDYYSVRKSGRTSGTVDVTKHFKAWESLGMDLWSMNDVSFAVEGYRNNGVSQAKVNHVSINVDYNNSEDSFILGDINGDGNTDSLDFGLLRSYLLGYRHIFEYDYGIEAADVNRDGEVNALDLALYKKYILGQTAGFY